MKKSKKLMKKLVMLVMAMALLLTMLPVSAATDHDLPETGKIVKEDSTANITVNGIGFVENEDGTTTYDAVSAYQIIEIMYDADSNNLTYVWASESVENTVKTAVNASGSEGSFTVEDYMDYVKGQQSDEDKDSVAKEVYEALVKAVYDNSLGLTEISGTVENGVATFSTLPMGQYLIIGKGQYVYSPMTGTLEPVVGKGINNNDVYYLYDKIIDAKNQKPSIDKELKDENDKDGVAYQDNVEFKLTLTVPLFPENAVNKTLKLTDTMQEGLQGVRDLKIDGYAPETYQGVAVKYDGDADVASGFEITFDMGAEGNSLASKTTIEVTYTATATAKIVPGNPVTNEVKLEWPKNIWSSDKEWSEDSDKEEVFTYGLNVVKIDGATKEALKGARFKLYTSEKGNDGISFEGASGSYNVAGKGTAVTELETDENGKLNLNGLDAGTYWLEETKAPTGYVKLDGRQKIEIVADAEKNGKTIEITVENNKGFGLLPKTGGMGTLIFTVTGIVLMCGAVVVLIAMSKKSRKEN